MPTVHDRLRAARKELGFTQQTLADALEVTKAAVSSYETGRVRPSEEVNTLLSSRGVSLHWLLTGQGEMLPGQSDGGTGAAPKVSADTLPAHTRPDETMERGDRIEGLSAPADLVAGLQKTVSLTLYTAVCAGDGTLIFDELSRISVDMPAGLAFHFFGFSPPEVMGVSEVVGDSMIPMFEPGDLVLYDLTPDATGGGVFVINYDGRAACKRVQPIGRAYRLIPENRAYQAELIRMTPEGYVHDETGDLIEFGIVGRILFPRPETPRMHVQQVADLLRGMFREAAAGAYN